MSSEQNHSNQCNQINLSCYVVAGHIQQRAVIMYTLKTQQNRQNKLNWSTNMDLNLVNFLARCQEEEREAIERWFKEFQTIELSRFGTMSVARVTSMQLSQPEK